VCVWCLRGACTKCGIACAVCVCVSTVCASVCVRCDGLPCPQHAAREVSCRRTPTAPSHVAFLCVCVCAVCVRTQSVMCLSLGASRGLAAATQLLLGGVVPALKPDFLLLVGGPPGGPTLRRCAALLAPVLTPECPGCSSPMLCRDPLAARVPSARLYVSCAALLVHRCTGDGTRCTSARTAVSLGGRGGRPRRCAGVLQAVRAGSSRAPYTGSGARSLPDTPTPHKCRRCPALPPALRPWCAGRVCLSCIV
jgi:hypothetical protein